MVDKNNKQKLYEALSADYSMGSFEQFSTDVEDEAKRQKLYDAIKDEYELPDFNQFTEQLVGTKQQRETAAAKGDAEGASTFSEAEIIAETVAAEPQPANDLPIPQAQGKTTSNTPTPGAWPYAGAHRMQDGYVVSNAPGRDTGWRLTNEDGTPRTWEQNVEATKTDEQRTREQFGEYRSELVQDLLTDHAKTKAVPSERVVVDSEGNEVERYEVTPELSQEEAEYQARDDYYKKVKLDGERWAELEAARKQVYDEYNKELGKANKEISELYQYVDAGAPVDIYDWVSNRRDVKALKGALKYYDEALTMVKEARAVNDSPNNFLGELAGLGRGLLDAGLDVSTWDMGMSDLDQGASTLSAILKLEAGKELTSAEQRLLAAAAANTYANSSLGEQMGMGYKAGQTTMMSVPFMIEMALNPASGLGSAGSKALSKHLIKKYGREMIQKQLKKRLARQTMAAKWGAKIGGDAGSAGVMTLTSGAAMTAADAVDRMTGTIKPTEDEEGNIVYGGREDYEKSALTAGFKAVASGSIERHTEMVGGYIPAMKTAGVTFLAKKMKAATNPRLRKIYREAEELLSGKAFGKWGEMVGKVADVTKLNDLAGEFFEEKIGEVENALLVGDMTFDTNSQTGIFNLDRNIETLVGLLPMQAFFGGMTALGYRTQKYRTNQALNKANKAAWETFGEDWIEMKDMIDGCETDKDLTKVVRGIISGGTTDLRSQAAVMQYVSAVQRQKGLQLVAETAPEIVAQAEAEDAAAAAMPQPTENTGAADAAVMPQPTENGGATSQTAYDRGVAAAEADDYAAMSDIGYEADLADARIERMFEEAQRAEIAEAENTEGGLETWLESNRESLSAEQAFAVQALIDANDAYDGLTETVRHRTASEEEAIRQEMQPLATADGRIVPLTLDNGQTVYLKSGDPTNRRSTVIAAYRDETGAVRNTQVSGMSITSIGTEQSLSDYALEAMGSINNERQQRIKDAMDGKNVAAGQTVRLYAGDELQEYEVTAVAPEGATLRSKQDGSEMTMTTEELQDELAMSRQKRIENDLAAAMPQPTENTGATVAAAAEAAKEEERRKPLRARVAQWSQDIGADIEIHEDTSSITSSAVLNQINSGQGRVRGWYDNATGKVHVYMPGITDEHDIDETVIHEIVAHKGLRQLMGPRFDALCDKVYEMMSEDARQKYLAYPGVNGDTRAAADEYMAYLAENMENLTAEEQNVWQAIVAAVREFIKSVMTGSQMTDAQIEQLIRASYLNMKAQRTQTTEAAAEPQLTENTRAAAAAEREQTVEAAAQVAEKENLEPQENAEKNVSLQTKEGRMGVVARQKNSAARLAKAKEIYGSDPTTAPFFDDMDVPQTAEELVAMTLVPRSINWEGIDRGTQHIRGLQEEMGRNKKRGIGRNFDTNGFNLYLAKKGEGVGIEKLVEDIWRSDKNGMGEGNMLGDQRRFDEHEIKDALLSLLSGAQTSKDISDYVLNNRIAQAEAAIEYMEEEAAYEQELYEQERREDAKLAGILELTEEDWLQMEAEYADKIAEIEAKEREQREIFQQILEQDHQQAEYYGRANQEEVASERGIRMAEESAERGTAGSAERGETVLRGAQDTRDEGLSVGDAQLSEGALGAQNGRDGRSEDVHTQEEERSDVGETEAVPQFTEELERQKAETNTNPTEAQKEAGNYKKGHLTFGGYKFTIENPKGSVRSGKNPKGKAWKVTMPVTYGYILGKKGKDGDHLDMFINDKADLSTWNGSVFVVDQVNPETGEFDEHKIMYGFNDITDAIRAYLMSYTRPWRGMKNITEVSKEKFDEWVASSDRKLKPFAETRFGDKADVGTKVIRAAEERAGKRQEGETPEQDRDKQIEKAYKRGYNSYRREQYTDETLLEMYASMSNEAIEADISKMERSIEEEKAYKDSEEYQERRSNESSDYTRAQTEGVAARAGKSVKALETNIAEAKRVLELRSMEERSAEEEEQVSFSIVTDPKKIAELEASPKRTGYRNVKLNEDGTFSSPMGYWLQSPKGGAKTRTKTDNFELGKWEEAQENPDLVDESNHIVLVKPDKGTVPVAYDPYIHNRLDPVNLQFKDAWKRDDLVYVETEVAETDLNSGYHADKALYPVGVHSWSNGDLMLSKYDKPVRVLPWEEVADAWAERLNGEGVNFDRVPKALRPLLIERGVEILPPTKGMGKDCKAAYEEWKDKGATELTKKKPTGSLSLLDVVRTLYSEGKEVASKLFSMKFFDVAQTPKFMQELGLRGDKFTIKYGVIARHLGKDGSHDLSERDWEQLPQALQNPFAISKLIGKDKSYRIYTTLQTGSGEYIVVGADVKNAGREIEVNAVSTVFGRRNNAHLPMNEEVIYRSNEITPGQSSLLERPNFAQYTTEQELSESKGTQKNQNEQEKGEKISFSVKPLAGNRNLTKGLRELEEGETCQVERIFTENKNFEFSSVNKVESYDDIAYIFKQLEDEAVENSFAVLVKRGKPTVIHLGMGHYTGTIVNQGVLTVAVNRVKPDKIYFVHNHPSGQLKASIEDIRVWQNLWEQYGSKLANGIIINTRSGKYGIFNNERSFDIATPSTSDADSKPLKVYSFNKQVFSKDYKPEGQIFNSEDVAKFVSSHRLGDRQKLGLILTNNKEITGNIFLPYSEITTYNARAIVNDIIYYTSVMGGTRAFMFGNVPLKDLRQKGISDLVAVFSNLRLVDYIEIDGGRYKSAADEDVSFSVVDDGTAAMPQYTKEEQGIVDEAKKSGTWMKAPNGKATNLTEKQWAQVRTKAFKKWFGDWELANLLNRASIAWNDKTSKGKVVMGLSERAKSRFNELLGTDIKQLVITDDAIRHIKKKHGENEELRGQKNMTPEDVVVIPYLINNFDSMELNPKENDNKGNRAIEIRKRINGISVIATIERGDNKEFLVTSYQYLKSDALDASNETPGLNVRNDSDIAKVRKDIENIKSLAKNSSKIVDENGEPMVVYHGSMHHNFTVFKNNGSGIYFTPDKEAADYGLDADPYAVFINMREPLNLDFEGDVDNEATENHDSLENEYKNAIAEGYDGVVAENTFDGENEMTQIVVHRSNQIKSATDNVGTFDEGNDDIRFSVEDIQEEYDIPSELFDYYKKSIELGNLTAATQALNGIKDVVRQNIGKKLSEFISVYKGIRDVIFDELGDIEKLREERERAALEQYDLMDAARKRAEEEAAIEAEKSRQLEMIVDLDSEYDKALQENDMERAQDLVSEAARRKGYIVTDYKDAHSAPVAQIEHKEFTNLDALRDLSDNGFDLNVFALANGISNQPLEIFDRGMERAYMNVDAAGRESLAAIRSAISAIKDQLSEHGEVKDMPKIKVYRAAPKSIKGGLESGGQWVSPSLTYTQAHGEHRHGEGKYRIIEEEVPADELWWDGNDVREWGFDDGRNYVYKNTKNNKKLFDTITYDDAGKIIPLSKRFNSKKPDVRFRTNKSFEAGSEYDVDKRANKYFEARGLVTGEYQTPHQLLEAVRNKHEEYAWKMDDDATKIECLGRWNELLPKTKKNGRNDKNHNERIAKKTERAKAMIGDVAKMLGLDVEVLEDTDNLTGKKKTAKGWYDVTTGKITVVLPNHTSNADVMATLLHEGVAHHGLRKMFGKDFDAMLDNVYEMSWAEDEIDALAGENASKEQIREATEEYLARLAEDMNFEKATEQKWWDYIREAFVSMLRKAGITIDVMLTDNELRYLLWRSYQNLKETAGKRTALETMEDHKKQKRLGVYDGNGRIEPAVAVAEDIRFRFIGEQGAANLDKAEEATARLDNLNVAREMEEAGKDAKSIKMATGWERGADKKWRYEVDDNMEGIASPMDKLTALYREYKAAEKSFDRLMETSNRLPRLPRTATEEQKAKRKEFDKRLKEARETWLAKREVFMEADNRRNFTLEEILGADHELFAAYPQLKTSEVSFMDKSDYAGYSGVYMPESGNFWISPTADNPMSVLTHEIQHAIQHIEGFAQGGNTHSSTKKIAEVMNVIGAPNGLPFNNLVSYLENGMETRQQHKQLLAMAEANGYDDIVDYVESLNPYGYYHRLSGEVEARNAAERMGMSSEERRASLAEETEDVAREDQVFIFDGLESAAMPQSTKLSASVAMSWKEGSEKPNSEVSADELRFRESSIEEFGESLGGTKVQFADSERFADDADAMERIERGDKGWYDTATGEVVIITENCADEADMARALLHEKLGHEGLAALLGGEKGVMKWGEYIWKSASESLRKRIAQRADKEGYPLSDRNRWSKAAQEVFADMASEGTMSNDEYSLWTKARHYVYRALKALNIRIPGSMTDADLRYYVKKTAEALKKTAAEPQTTENREHYEGSRMAARGDGRPRKKRNESQAQYNQRLLEWERRQVANENDPAPEMPELSAEEIRQEYNEYQRGWMARHGLPEDYEPGVTVGDENAQIFDREKHDSNDPYIEMLGYIPEAMRRWREEYHAWEQRNALGEAENVDLLLYNGESSNRPDDATSMEAEARLGNTLRERTIFDEISEAVGFDNTPEGAKRHAKNAVINRRKELESASAEDAIFIQGLGKKIDGIAKRLNVKSKDVRSALITLIELPIMRKNKEQAEQEALETINTSEAMNNAHTKLTLDNLRELREQIGNMLSKHVRHKEDQNNQEKWYELYEAAMTLSDALNQMNAGNEGYVALYADDVIAAYKQFEAAYAATAELPSSELLDKLENDETTKELLGEIKDWYDLMYHYIENAGLRGDAGYIAEGYVNHIWDKSKSDPEAYDRYVRLKSANMRHREIPTYADGIAVGLVPKFTDILDIMSYYSRQNIEAVSNRHLLDNLLNLCVDVKNTDGEVVQQLPVVTTASPSFGDRSRYERYEIPGISGDVWVLKDVKGWFNAIFGTERTPGIGPKMRSAAKAYDVLSGILKTIQLSFSFFHAGALTEVSVAQQGPIKGFKDILKYIIVESAFKGTMPAYAHPADFKLAASHLVQLGATKDYAAAEVAGFYDKIHEVMQDFRKEHPNPLTWTGELAAALPKYLNKGMSIMLWEYLHDGLKIALFKKLAGDVDKRLLHIYNTGQQGTNQYEDFATWQESKAYRILREQMLDEAGQYVNDTFGGQYWELMNVSPTLIKWLRRALLSPDWLISTQRHFFSMFGFGSLYSEGNFREWIKYNTDNLQRLLGKDVPRNELRRMRSKNAKECYLIGVAIFYYAAFNIINAIARAGDEDDEKKKAEEIRKTNPDYKSPYELAYPDGMKWWEYTMLGNSPRHETHLFLGRYEDGTEYYVRWGKQFREFPELFIGKNGFEFPGPLIERMKGKSNPLLRYTEGAFGVLDIHGYNAPYDMQEMRDKYGKEITLLAYTAQQFLPFSVPTQEDKEFKLLDLAMPSQKGFTRWKAVNYFEDFIVSGEMDGIERTYKAAVMNGINAEECLQAAIARVKATQRKEMGDGITDLQGAYERFDASKDLAERKLMRQKMRKYLSQSGWKNFSKADAVEKVQEFINGGSKEYEANNGANDSYLMAATAADIAEDWRIDSLYQLTTPIAKELKDMQNAGVSAQEVNAYAKNHEKMLEARKTIGSHRRVINILKRDIALHKDSAMTNIREKRKELLETLGENKPENK